MKLIWDLLSEKQKWNKVNFFLIETKNYDGISIQISPYSMSRFSHKRDLVEKIDQRKKEGEWSEFHIKYTKQKEIFIRRFKFFRIQKNNFHIQKMADANLEKQLKIKLGSLKRLHKEYLSYVKEAETQQNKINKMKEENVDEYTVKKQVQYFPLRISCLADLDWSSWRYKANDP